MMENIEQIMAEMPRAKHPFSVMSIESESTWRHYTEAQCRLDAQWILDHRKVPSVPIVCLCGSTRFSEEFQKAQLNETLAGKIVLTIGCNMRSDAELLDIMSEQERAEIKAKLDELHLRKIDLADEVLILNRDGYIGDSTKRELAYAKEQGKVIRYLEPKWLMGKQDES